MRRTVLFAPALSFAVALAGGCADPRPADDIKPVAPPAELVGKWRDEVTFTDERTKLQSTSRTQVYHFFPDGRFEVETYDTIFGRKQKSKFTSGTVVKAELDRFSMVDLTRVGNNRQGIPAELGIPAEDRRTRSYQFRVMDDELHWSEVDEAGKPVPQAKPVVLKRVKE